MSAHVRERLSAYLDGELEPAERSAVDRHLALCPACATLLGELAAVDASLAELPPPETTADDAFAARVRARIEAEAERRAPAGGRAPRGRLRLPAWTWAAVAAALVAVVTPLTLRELRLSGTSTVLDGVAPATPPLGPARTARGASQPQGGATEPHAATHEPRVGGAASGVAPADSRRRESFALQDAAAPDRGGSAAPRPPAPAPPPAAAKQPAVAVPPVVEGDIEGAVEGSVAGGVVGGAASGVAEEEMAFAGPPGERSVDREDAPEQKGLVREEHPAAERQTRAKAAAPAPGAFTDEAATTRGNPAFGRLAAQRPRTAEEWRRLREAWRALARAQGGSALADEAHVRAVEAAAGAYRASGDAGDERVLQRDVGEYLARKHAPQRERVRRLLREAER